MIEDATAPFAYVRLHGAERLYTSGYDLPALHEWAERVRLWSLGAQTPGARFSTMAKREPRDVFVYFDNDVKVRAPFDAANLRRILNGQPAAEAPPDLERVSEEPRTSWPVWEALARART